MTDLYRKKKSPDTPDQLTRPPHIIDDVLMPIAAEALNTRETKLHAAIPRDARTLAQWWTTIQERPHDIFDRPQQRSTRSGDGGNYWLTPYHDRLADTLRRFIQLDADFQGWIIAAREDGIFWRGDDREMFHRVIVETEKFRSMPRNEYVTGAKKRMIAAIGAMTK